jgi:hypothetical protein
VNIQNEENYTASPGASAEFAQIQDNLTKLRESSSPGNQLCYLSYFIMFFTKFLFFTGRDATDIANRKVLMGTLDGIADRVGGGDKDRLYTIVGLIFRILDAGESIFITNKKRDGKEVFKGLSLIKFEGDTALLKEVFAAFRQPVQQITVDNIEKSLFDNMQITQPKIYVNPPIDSLGPYPSLTYVPEGVNIENLAGSVLEVDIDNGYTEKSIDTNGPVKGSVITALNNKNMCYTTLLAAFVVFARKYIIAAKEDLTKYKCQIPAAFENTRLFEGAAPITVDRTVGANTALRGLAQLRAAAGAGTISFGGLSAKADTVKTKPPTFPILGTFTKTIHAILNQIRSGSTLLSGLIKEDISRYSSTQDSFPIKKLSDKYTRLGKTALNTAHELKLPYNENGMDDDAIKAKYKTFFDSIWTSIKASPQGSNMDWAKKFFKNMILDIFTAYVNQYDIEGAADLPSKIAKVLPQIKGYVGDINLKNRTGPGDQEQTLFAMLGLNDKILTDAATSGLMQPLIK